MVRVELCIGAETLLPAPHRDPRPATPPARASLWLRGAATICRQLPIARYRAVVWLAKNAASPFIAQLPKRLDGARFVCNPRNWVTAQAYFAGVFEPQETAVLQSVLRPGSTFVDVGANWGYFTLLAAPRVGPDGTVIAVEPEPGMCSTLRANVDLNGFSNVSVHQVAAAEEEGRISFLPFDEILGNYGVSRLTAADEQDSRAIVVQARPLDELLADCGIRKVSLLKLDVEGAEARALGGLQRSLVNGIVDRLLLEVHPEQLKKLGSSVNEVFELLTRAQFHGWRLDHSPAASRRAAYAHRVDPRAYLRPLDPSAPLDAWPHFLWTRRGVDPL